MNDLANLARLLENLLRLGTIEHVQHNPPRVKVKTGTLLTAWLPWLAARAGTSQEWDPPTVGEQVLLLSPSGQLANGIALTGIFSSAHPANGNRAGLHRRTYPDGAVVEYDSIAKQLKATLPAGGKVQLIAPGGFRFEGDIEHIGNLTQTGSQTVSGDVVAGGISLKNHKHPGDSGGTTGAPIP